jgi:type I restriction enzyme, S subunit
VTTLGRYAELQETQYAWLGAVPRHWLIVPFRRLFRESSEVNGAEPVGPMLSVSGHRGVEIKRYESESLMRSDDLVENYRVVRPGQLAVNTMWLNYAGLGVSSHLGHVSPAYRAYSFLVECDRRYVHYLLRSEAYVKGYTGHLRGIRPNSLQMDRATLMTWPVLLPPRHEQRAIADYLDRETAKIDTLLARQQRLIGTLRERRQALRDRHFFGKDGKRQTTLRRVLTALQRPAPPDLGVITAYRDGEVTLRSNRREEGYTFSDTEHGYQEVLPGDLVFHALDGFAGAVGISDSHGIATPVYHVCQVTTDDDPHYLAMLLRYLGVSGFLATQAPNVRQRSVDFRNWNTFARVPIALPPPAEQRQVVAAIEEQSAQIDHLILKSERFIELSRERRSALIAAAVTGQIDVREAVA